MGKHTFEIEFAGIRSSKTIHIKNPEIQDGFWSDKTGTTTEAIYGEKVKFTIGTKDLIDGTELNLTLYDYDGTFLPAQELSRNFKATVKNNVAELEFTPDIKWAEKAEYEIDEVVEAYFKVEATTIVEKKLTPNPVPSGVKLEAKLPKKEDNYLKIYGKPEVITVLIELPHSGATDYLDAKGLAGHSAIMIDDEYYDFGPDGDALYADGTPWWDTNSSAGNYKRSDMLNILNDNRLRRGDNIIGEVYLIDIEISLKEKEAIEKWWKDRYKNLGTYSIIPALGEQCTTTVKISLSDSTEVLDVNAPFSFGAPTNLKDHVQTPLQLKEYLLEFAGHTYGKNKGKKLTPTKRFAEI